MKRFCLVNFLGLALVLALAFSIVGCGPGIPDPAEEEPPAAPDATEATTEEKAFPDNAFEILDNRENKTPLAGKYICEGNNRHRPFSYEIPVVDYLDYSFEIYDEYALLSRVLRTNVDRVGPPDRVRVMEVTEVEGVTWICFRTEDVGATGNENPLYFYSVLPGSFVCEDAWYPPYRGDVYVKTESEPAAEDGSKSPSSRNGALNFDPKTFTAFGKTLGQLASEDPDLEHGHITTGGEYGTFPSLYAYYFSPLNVMYYCFDYTALNDASEVVAFGALANEIFPNLGDRLFVWELEEIIDHDLFVDRELDYWDYYNGAKASFSYQGWVFWYYPRGSYDLVPWTIVFAKPEDNNEEAQP